MQPPTKKRKIDAPIVGPQKLCEVCGGGGKYRCPRCFIVTCSVDCCKKHKIEKNCSGERKKGEFVSIEEFSDNQLRDDCLFISECERVNDVTRRKRHEKMRQRHLSVYLKILLNQTQQRHIQMKILPKFMTRRKKNSTYFDKSKNVILWHIEWRFFGTNFSCDSIRADETLIISNILEQILAERNSVAELSPYTALPKEEDLHVFMKVENWPGNDMYYKVDKAISLKDCMTRKLIIEFPIFLVVLPIDVAKIKVLTPEQEASLLAPTVPIPQPVPANAPPKSVQTQTAGDPATVIPIDAEKLLQATLADIKANPLAKAVSTTAHPPLAKGTSSPTPTLPKPIPDQKQPDIQTTPASDLNPAAGKSNAEEQQLQIAPAVTKANPLAKATTNTPAETPGASTNPGVTQQVAMETTETMQTTEPTPATSTNSVTAQQAAMETDSAV